MVLEEDGSSPSLAAEGIEAPVPRSSCPCLRRIFNSFMLQGFYDCVCRSLKGERGVHRTANDPTQNTKQNRWGENKSTGTVDPREWRGKERELKCNSRHKNEKRAIVEDTM